jgi:hypothetical protein
MPLGASITPQSFAVQGGLGESIARIIAKSLQQNPEEAHRAWARTRMEQRDAEERRRYEQERQDRLTAQNESRLRQAIEDAWKTGVGPQDLMSGQGPLTENDARVQAYADAGKQSRIGAGSQQAPNSVAFHIAKEAAEAEGFANGSLERDAIGNLKPVAGKEAQWQQTQRRYFQGLGVRLPDLPVEPVPQNAPAAPNPGLIDAIKQYFVGDAKGPDFPTPDTVPADQQSGLSLRRSGEDQPRTLGDVIRNQVMQPPQPTDPSFAVDGRIMQIPVPGDQPPQTVGAAQDQGRPGGAPMFPTPDTVPADQQSGLSLRRSGIPGVHTLGDALAAATGQWGLLGNDPNSRAARDLAGAEQQRNDAAESAYKQVLSLPSLEAQKQALLEIGKRNPDLYRRMQLLDHSRMPTSR